MRGNLKVTGAAAGSRDRPDGGRRGSVVGRIARGSVGGDMGTARAYRLTDVNVEGIASAIAPTGCATQEMLTLDEAFTLAEEQARAGQDAEIWCCRVDGRPIAYRVVAQGPLTGWELVAHLFAHGRRAGGD